MIALIDSLLITIVMVALAAATIQDIKKREVPDWISYGLLFFVIATRTLQAMLTKAPEYMYITILAAVIFFAFGNLMYFTKQWGGGDAKLITGLGAAFAIRPEFIQQTLLPFPVILIINILLVGMIYGLLYAIALAFKERKDFIKDFVKINALQSMKKMKWCALLLALILIISPYVMQLEEVKRKFAALALVLLVMPYLYTMIKSVERVCMFKKVPVGKVTEGDWIERIVNKKIKNIKFSKYGISKKEIQNLKKLKVKEVVIKEGIPFVPSFFIGALVTLWLGNIIFLSWLLI